MYTPAGALSIKTNLKKSPKCEQTDEQLKPYELQ